VLVGELVVGAVGVVVASLPELVVAKGFAPSGNILPRSCS